MTGNDAAAPIWTDFIKRALALRPDLNAEKFTPPPGMNQVEIAPQTGMLATENCAPRNRLMTNTSKTSPNCSKDPSNQADQNKPALRKGDSALAGDTRRRSVRRPRPETNSAPARNELFQRITNQGQLGPVFLPPIIRRRAQ